MNYTLQERAAFCRAHKYYEVLSFHRWQRLTNLINSKVMFRSPITRAEILHCQEALSAMFQEGTREYEQDKA